VIDRRAPVLRHFWLGSLYRDGDQELIGSIELDPAIRAPRGNGDRDAEVLLEVGGLEPGAELDAHLDACAARIRQALERLPDLKRYALDHAPPSWAQYYADQPGLPLADRLFLDGLLVSRQLLVSLAFDFGTSTCSSYGSTLPAMAKRYSCKRNHDLIASTPTRQKSTHGQRVNW
jgi:hypothetical protein